MLTPEQRRTTRVMCALFFLAGAAVAFPLGARAARTDPTPGRTAVCDNAAVNGYIATNLIAVAELSDDEIAALKELPAVCYTDPIYPNLDPVVLDLLARSPVNASP